MRSSVTLGVNWRCDGRLIRYSFFHETKSTSKPTATITAPLFDSCTQTDTLSSFNIPFYEHENAD